MQLIINSESQAYIHSKYLLGAMEVWPSIEQPLKPTRYVWQQLENINFNS